LDERQLDDERGAGAGDLARRLGPDAIELVEYMREVAGGDPIPVSVTSSLTASASSPSVENVATTVTRPPAGVYLTPLSIRLISTCRTRLRTAEMITKRGSESPPWREPSRPRRRDRARGHSSREHPAAPALSAPPGPRHDRRRLRWPSTASRSRSAFARTAATRRGSHRRWPAARSWAGS